MKTIKEAADSLLQKGEINLDEYKELEKIAAAPPKALFKMHPYLRHVADAATSAWPIMAVMGAGAMGKSVLVDPVIQSARINKSFREMDKKVPALEGKDKDVVKDYFNVVRTFSPRAASNPIVAGNLVNKMIEFGGVDHKLVQDLTSIESGYARPHYGQEAALSAVKGMAGFQDYDHA